MTLLPNCGGNGGGSPQAPSLLKGAMFPRLGGGSPFITQGANFVLRMEGGSPNPPLYSRGQYSREWWEDLPKPSPLNKGRIMSLEWWEDPPKPISWHQGIKYALDFEHSFDAL